MPTTLTLKNIPDELYDRLRQAAEASHRSLNSEAIVCLEAVLLPSRATAQERIARARQLRGDLHGKFAASEIAKFRETGRR